MRWKAILCLASMLAFPTLGWTQKSDQEEVQVVKQQIERELKPGDPEAAILALIKKTGWAYTFNPFDGRFECSVPSSRKTDERGVRSLLTINIYVDEKRAFKRAEVRMLYRYV